MERDRPLPAVRHRRRHQRRSSTIRRGVRLSPELDGGLWGTLALAVLATVGQVVVPIAVQQTLDRGLNGPSGPDVAFMSRWAWSPRSRSWSPAWRPTS